MTRVIVGLVAMAVCAACGASGDAKGASATPGASSPATSPTVSAPATPTPSPVTTRDRPQGRVATVAQFAHVILGESHQIMKYERLTNGCVDKEGLCPIWIFTAGVVGATLAVRIRDAEDPSSRVYIGRPPQELSGIVASTKANALNLQQTSKYYLHDKTNATAGTAIFALSTLATDMGAWKDLSR